MSLPPAISSKSDAADYVAYSVSGLIARLRGSQDLLVSEAALDLEKKIRGVLEGDRRLADRRPKQQEPLLPPLAVCADVQECICHGQNRMGIDQGACGSGHGRMTAAVPPRQMPASVTRKCAGVAASHQQAPTRTSAATAVTRASSATASRQRGKGMGLDA